MPAYLESLSNARIGLLNRSKTIFFFAVGPIEDHGPHLPVGLDGFVAERLAWKLGERLEADGWTAILLPRLPLGVDSNTRDFSLKVRPYVLRDLLIDWCMGFFKKGFQHFVCVSGHLGPRQLTAIEEAGKFLDRRRGGYLTRFLKLKRAVLISASSAQVNPKLALGSPLKLKAKEHGGAEDTSLALFMDARVVDPAYSKLEPVSAKAAKGKGYWGSPATGNPETGKKWLEEQAELLYPKVRAVLEGSNPQAIFRSWYSVFPPNWSFFHGWLLVGGISILMMVWFYISLSGL